MPAVTRVDHKNESRHLAFRRKKKVICTWRLSYTIYEPQVVFEYGTDTLTCSQDLGFVNSDGQAILHTRSQRPTNQLMTMSSICRLTLLFRKLLPLVETPTKMVGTQRLSRSCSDRHKAIEYWQCWLSENTCTMTEMCSVLECSCCCQDHRFPLRSQRRETFPLQQSGWEVEHGIKQTYLLTLLSFGTLCC